MIVAGAGTGGTLTGLARKMKERVSNITVSSFSYEDSIFLSLILRLNKAFSNVIFHLHETKIAA